MSVSWTTINPVIKQVLSDLVRKSSIQEEDWSALWEERDEGADFINPYQDLALYLKITSCVGIGEDEIRNEMRPVPDSDPVVEDLYAISYGHRRFVLQIQAWQFEHRDDNWAIGTLEKIRTGLNRPSVIGQFLDVETVVTDIGSSRKTTAQTADRRWSVGILEVTFNTVAEDQDPVPIGWIAAIRMTTKVKSADGVELPSPPNIDDELLPEDYELPFP